ncbi:hypothetical protein AGR56_04965 [Clostridium sp. DMHC 10]|uniref:PilN domain-containing protein n=1 Tax=Clostridium sp. DMHC 10 TaxID=747377 RepID=UPI00069F2607|nr:PilN domain-containing protein [Clostridium sp. DMHC 10]KOF56227.1 hypothetical protein AGR56_04965 [Clostridium sp. DMHC 10]
MQAQHDLLTKKISKYKSRIEIVDKLTKNKVMLNQKIEDISKGVSSDIKFDSISFDDKEGITIVGETSNSKAPAAWVANLQMAYNYANARLTNVTNLQDDNSNSSSNNGYKFTVNLGDGLDAKNNTKR